MNTATNLGTLLTDLARRHRVPTAQLAVHADGITTTYAASGTCVDVDPTARIPIGSITKAFTAALVMLLVADGDLGLGDAIGTHLADLGTGPGDHPGNLTVRQVLSHTSGLPSSVGMVNASPRQYLRACRDLPLVHAPGAGFSYSNVGYVLLGRLVERLTGMSWSEAVDALLLAPLGIKPSFVVGERAGDPFLAGHSVGTVVRSVRQTLGEAEAPAGALALSAGDLVTFGLALINADPAGNVVSDGDDFRPMRRPLPGVEPFGLADGWGLGLALFHGEGGEWVGHDGTADGTSCHLRIDPAHGRVIALAANAGTGVDLWHDLVDGLRGHGLPVGDYTTGRALAQPVDAPGELAGRYANGDLEYVVDTHTGAGPVLVVSGEVYPDLVVHCDGAFSVRDTASGKRVLGGRFLWDQHTGQVRGIQTGGRVARRRESNTLVETR